MKGSEGGFRRGGGGWMAVGYDHDSYPMIATVVEASVNDLTGDIAQGNLYEWNQPCNSQSCPTHVIIWVGIAPDGNLLAWNYANVVGPLQGNNSVRPQPRTYDIRSIDNQFATVVQAVGPNAANPWLRQIHLSIQQHGRTASTARISRPSRT
jgi:hypothetical protein